MKKGAALREDLMADLAQIPDREIPAVYAVLHYFRLGLQASEPKATPPAATTARYAGVWQDMPREMFTDLLGECAQRRARAFSARRTL